MPLLDFLVDHPFLTVLVLGLNLFLIIWPWVRSANCQQRTNSETADLKSQIQDREKRLGDMRTERDERARATEVCESACADLRAEMENQVNIAAHWKEQHEQLQVENERIGIELRDCQAQSQRKSQSTKKPKS